MSLAATLQHARWAVPLRIARARPRLFIAMACGAVLGLLLPHDWRLVTRLLVDWNFGAFLYFVLVGRMVLSESHAKISQRAEQQDEGRFAILIFATLAAAAAFGAIVAELGTLKNVTGLLKDLHVALSAATIVSAWTLIHLMFALHYAHEYVIERAATATRPAKPRGGLIFPETATPDYLDFIYFSFIIGVACQTADVEISSPIMRRISLVHSVLAFFFNSAVLALTINIAAGLI